MPPSPTRFATLGVVLIGLALASFSAWSHGDAPLVAVGVVVMIGVGAGAIYAWSRRP